MHFDHDAENETRNVRSKILVVDDQAVIREPIAASLRHAGYLTVCAANGADALVAARAERPDLVLLDLSMPEMDGLAFLKQFRADPVNAATPVIMLTASTDAKDAAEARQLGVREVMIKSQFSLLNLMDRISQQIARGNADVMEKVA